MKLEEKQEIEKIAKEFASGFDFKITGSGWLIVDPLSAFLNASGFENELQEMPACEDHAQVLIMTFKDGSRFIPAGSDLPHGATDWMWL